MNNHPAGSNVPDLFTDNQGKGSQVQAVHIRVIRRTSDQADISAKIIRQYLNICNSPGSIIGFTLAQSLYLSV